MIPKLIPIIPGKEANAVTVQLEIDFTGKQIKSDRIKFLRPKQPSTNYWRPQKVGEGSNVQATGSGATMFVKSISGVQNRGAAGDNWVFQVNDRVGDRLWDLSCFTGAIM